MGTGNAKTYDVFRSEPKHRKFFTTSAGWQVDAGMDQCIIWPPPVASNIC